MIGHSNGNGRGQAIGNRKGNGRGKGGRRGGRAVGPVTSDLSPVTPHRLELDLSEDEARRVLPQWEVGQFVGLPRERGGTANPAVVVDAEAGRFFLKRRNPRYSAPEMLRHDHALMEHLAGKGLPTPLAVPTCEGARWAEVEGQVYELYPYMPGEAHDPENEAQLPEAGRRLAEFHRAASDFEPPAGKEWPRYHDPRNSVAGLEWAEELLRGQDGPTRSGRSREEALREVRALLELARRLAHEFGDEEYWSHPVVLVHGDWHPANVKYRGERMCGIFDLDWATRQPRLVDIADGVMYFAGRRPGGFEATDIRTLTRAFTLDERRTRVFIEGYRTEGTVEAEELRWLPAYLLARWLYSRLDPMRRKIPEEEAVDYLLEGVWGPIAEIQGFDASHKLFT